MKKINLFFILAFEEQTYKYDKKIKTMLKKESVGNINQVSSIIGHYFMLSKHFNLYNFFEYEDVISSYENAVIYHIPAGLNIDTGVEKKLLKFKGKVPIVMRSYDPHTPLKTSEDYMTRYHDLCITYLSERVNNDNIIFGHVCFDSYLIKKYVFKENRKHFMCMILRRRTDKERFVDKGQFLEMGLNLQKSYGEREKIISNDNLHIYGMDWPTNLKNYKGIIAPYEQKYEIMQQYRFNIIFENAIVNSYISEKILDSFLTLSVPVYLGSPVISEFINPDCYIDLSKHSDYNKLIDELKNMPDATYRQFQQNILNNRDSIFEKFSTKENFSKPLYDWYNKHYHTDLGLTDMEYKQLEAQISKLHFHSGNRHLFDIVRHIRLIMQGIKEKGRKELP